MENNKITETSSAPQNRQQDANREQKTVLENMNNRDSSDQSIKTQADKIVGQAKEKAVGVLDEQKSKVSDGLSSVADSIRQVGENLRGEANGQNAVSQTTARYGETLAEKIEEFSGYIENATIRDLTRDIERFARRQPALFVGGAFLVGVLATRFLKTSAPQNQTRQNSVSR